MPKLETPPSLTFPASTRRAISPHDSSTGMPLSSGQWNWNRSRRSTPSRRSEASHSCRMPSGRRDRFDGTIGFCGSHCRPHLVNTSGRSAAGRSFNRRPMTSSEWPRPYTAAVSIQFTPSSSARRIDASDASSSWGPQPKDQPPPPAAHAPKPTTVISGPLSPRVRVGRIMVPRALSYQLQLSAVAVTALQYTRRAPLRPRDSRPSTVDCRPSTVTDTA